MQKTILVTGASSGIGFDSVRVLIQHGFNVVATVRKTEDETHLLKIFDAKIKIIKIDLSDLSRIEKLPEMLKHELKIDHLYGLVNNAGIALAAPFAHQNFSEVQAIVQINVLSLMKTTQVLLPFFKKDSRIVNISSISGKSAAPFLAVYAATKHAVEGFSEALRKEMMFLGVKVIVVAPGSINTPIWKKGFEVIQNKYVHTEFAKPFALFIKFAMSEAQHSLPVEVVSSAVLTALTAPNPKFRYAPIPRKFVNWYLPKLIPEKIYNRMTAKALGLLGE